MALRSTILKLNLAIVGIACVATPAMAQSNDARAAAASERGVAFFKPEDFALNPGPTDHDIVLMEPYKPWYFTTRGEVDVTDNAFLTAPKHADTWVSASADAGFESTIAESFDLQVGGQLSASRFRRYSELDTDTIAGIVSISKAYDATRFGFEYIPSAYYGRGFDDRSLLSNEIAIYGRYDKQLDAASSGTLYARLSRRWTDPHDYTNTRFAVTAAWQHACTPALTMNVGLTLAYALYDDYFESTTGERRRELLVNPYVSFDYQINSWSTVGVSLSYARNYSSIPQVDYEASTFAPYVELNWRF